MDLAERGNMVQGKEWKHILLFTLPLMVGHALQQLYNTVDGIVVGNYIGDAALAAVGTCAPLTLVFIALSIGMSNGSSVVVAQYYGAQKYDEMRRAVSTALLMLFALGAVLSVVGVLVARPMLAHVLNVGPAYLDYAADYFRVYAIGLVFQFIYNACAAMMRALGDSRATLYFLLVSSVVNVGLDLLFVITFQMGTAGAAWATIISQAMAALVAVIYMYRRHPLLAIPFRQLRFYGDSAALCMKMAVPTTLGQCVVSCGSLALQRLVNSFDLLYPGIMAGGTAGMRVDSFITIPIFSFNVAVSAFTGQNVGAGRLDRVERGRRAATLMSLAICLVISAIGVIFRGPLVELFGVSGQALYFGKLYLTIFCPGLLLFSLHMSTSGVMQGAGDVKYNTFVTLSSFALRCILAYTLAYLTPLSYYAIWLATPLSWAYNIVMSWTRFYSGKWKEKSLVGVPAEMAEEALETIDEEVL